MSKYCARCKQLLEDENFSKNLRNKDGLHSYCRKCNSEVARQYNQTKGKTRAEFYKRKQMKSGYFRYGYGAWKNMGNSAKKRGINFNLTPESLLQWWISTEDKCHYCANSPIEYQKMRNYLKKYTGDNDVINKLIKTVFNKQNYWNIEELTIDRVDNSKGYDISNITKACWICNSLKSSLLNEKEMMIYGVKIKKIIHSAMNGDDQVG